MSYLLKGCVRCGGDLCEGWDFLEGFYRSCLQCGRRPGTGHIDVRGAGGLGIATAGMRSPAGTSSHRVRPP